MPIAIMQYREATYFKIQRSTYHLYGMHYYAIYIYIYIHYRYKNFDYYFHLFPDPDSELPLTVNEISRREGLNICYFKLYRTFKYCSLAKFIYFLNVTDNAHHH